MGLLLAALALAVLAGSGTPAYAWSYPAALNTNAATDSGYDSSPQVTTDGAGNWVAVWHSNENLGGAIGTDYDILVARSTNNGATWTAPAALNTNAATDSGSDRWPQVTTDGAGKWVAVWESTENLGGTIGGDWDILVARSTNNGATWTAPAALNTNAATDSGSDGVPQVTTDGLGNWVAVWDSNENLGGAIGTDYDILVARSTNNGATWTAPAALNTNAATDSGSDYEPQVTTDGGGNWVAVWDSNENLGGTIGTDYDILVARSTNKGATWTAPTTLNTNAASDSGGDGVPQVTTDGLGHWVAVWHSNDSLGGTIGTDYDILVARSTNNGATWTAPTALNTNAATDSGHDYASQVATDGAGNWVAAWWSNDTLGGTIGTDFDILVARSTNNGATWTAPAALNTNAATDSGGDYYPQVTTDGAGHWLTVWYSYDSLGDTIGTDYDILYARGDEAPPISSVAVGTDGYAFGLDSGNNPWYNHRTGGSWGGWQGLGGKLTGRLSAAATASNDVYVFGLDAGANPWYKHWNGTSWEAWTGLGGKLTGSLSAVAAGSDVYAFGLDSGNNPWYNRRTGGSWGGWQGLGGKLSGSLSAAAAGSDVYVFGLDSDNNPWYNLRSGGSWGGWQGLGGKLSGSLSAVAAGSDVYVFGLDSGNNPWYNRRSGGSWSGWQGLGGKLTGSLSAVAAGSDVYVFGLDSGNNPWYNRRSGGSWGGWQGLGGKLTGRLSVAATASNDVYVFGLDAGASPWYKHWNGTSWEAWTGLGGILAP
jgi:hypothetical protein